jgi:GNAT superfamily N-acetyltransferase
MYTRECVTVAPIVINERPSQDDGFEGMAIRRATQSDVARIMEIRRSVRENRLSDPNLVTADDCAEFIERSEMWVWDAEGVVQGFAAGDVRDGWIWALFVAPEYEGRGIGRALLSMACETLRKSGYTVANLSTAAGTRAERFYIENGWTLVNRNGRGELLFNKHL